MVCGWWVQILVVHLRYVLRPMTRECADVRCSVRVQILMTGLVSRDVFLNTLAKSVPYVRLGFLRHSMNGAVNYAGSAP
jgi:hypothetical protein